MFQYYPYSKSWVRSVKSTNIRASWTNYYYSLLLDVILLTCFFFVFFFLYEGFLKITTIVICLKKGFKITVKHLIVIKQVFQIRLNSINTLRSGGSYYRVGLQPPKRSWPAWVAASSSSSSESMSVSPDGASTGGTSVTTCSLSSCSSSSSGWYNGSLSREGKVVSEKPFYEDFHEEKLKKIIW